MLQLLLDIFDKKLKRQIKKSLFFWNFTDENKFDTFKNLYSQRELRDGFLLFNLYPL